MNINTTSLSKCVCNICVYIYTYMYISKYHVKYVLKTKNTLHTSKTHPFSKRQICNPCIKPSSHPWHSLEKIPNVFPIRFPQPSPVEDGSPPNSKHSLAMEAVDGLKFRATVTTFWDVKKTGPEIMGFQLPTSGELTGFLNHQQDHAIFFGWILKFGWKFARRFKPLWFTIVGIFQCWI